MAVRPQPSDRHRPYSTALMWLWSPEPLSFGAFAVDSVPEWEAPLRVLRYPDPRLRAVNARLGPSAFDARLKELASQMFDVMYT